MLELLRNLTRQKRLLKELVARDLKARYVGSSMGFFWSVLYPIINLTVYSFVFSVILKARFDDKMPPEETVLLMFVGILIWGSFAESISRCTNSLVENANLIQKVVFPSEVLVPYLSVSSLVNMTIGLPLILAGVAWFGYVEPRGEAPAQAAPVAAPVQVAALDRGHLATGAPGHALPEVQAEEPAQQNPRTRYSDHEHVDVSPRYITFGPGLLALPVLVLLQMLFTVGLGYFLSAFNLLLRDTFHLIGVFLTVWMFSTPIFYPPQLVVREGFGWVLAVNPMYWLIDLYRDVMLYGEWPDPLLVLRFALAAAVTLFLGASFFQRQKPGFPDLL